MRGLLRSNSGNVSEGNWCRNGDLKCSEDAVRLCARWKKTERLGGGETEEVKLKGLSGLGRGTKFGVDGEHDDY